MTLTNKISIAGQWFGFYSYGPEYGDYLDGQKVTFSFLIERASGHTFRGKCIELEGPGASVDISTIEGALDNNVISFRKEYVSQYDIDEFGKTVIAEPAISNRLFYKGRYDESSAVFSGSWEIWREYEMYDGTVATDLFTGHWEMSKEAKRYGI